MSTVAVTNRAYRLRRRPVGPPTPEDIELVSEELPALGDGEALVRTRTNRRATPASAGRS